MSFELPPTCKDLLTKYKYAFMSYYVLRQDDKDTIEVKNILKLMRKEYLMKCPIPKAGIGFPPKIE